MYKTDIRVNIGRSSAFGRYVDLTNTSIPQDDLEMIVVSKFGAIRMKTVGTTLSDTDNKEQQTTDFSIPL